MMIDGNKDRTSLFWQNVVKKDRKKVVGRKALFEINVCRGA